MPENRGAQVHGTPPVSATHSPDTLRRGRDSPGEGRESGIRKHGPYTADKRHIANKSEDNGPGCTLS